MIPECACHASTNPIQRTVNTVRPRQPAPEAVSFAQFARAGRRLGWSIDFLTKIFRGKVEDPRDLLERIFDRHDRHGTMLIPYRSLLDFYWRETASKRRSAPRRKAPNPPRVSYIFSAQTGDGLPAPHPAPESPTEPAGAE